MARTVHFKYGNHDEINDIDEIRSCLSEYIHDHFRLLSKDEHLEKAVRILLRRATNRFDTRLLFIDQFRGPSDPNFKPIEIMGQVLCCDDTVYNREVARQLNLLMVERSLRPGRSLQRLPTLYSRQHTHKMSLYCPEPRLPTICVLMPPKGDKNDFDQTVIQLTMFFDRPIIYKTVAVNAFGAKVGVQSVTHQSNRVAIIELTPDKAVTSFVLDVKPI